MTTLVSILRDHIHSSQTPPFTTDWGALLTLAKQHEVMGVVYSQCKHFIPQPFFDKLNRVYSSVIFYYTNRRITMEKVNSALADIEHFTIKGTSVAQFYPFPAFRTMGDTDIVVHTEDREEADRRLRGFGFNCVSSFDDREWQYYYMDMEFELHDHLVYSESVNVDIQEQYFNDFWKYVRGKELDWNFHFLFLIFHLRKHFMNQGVGFRHFLDIAVLVSRGPEINWEWVKGELEKLGLWEFAKRIFALNEYWFEVPSPFPVTFPESFFISATDLITKNGIWGFHNEENAGNAAVNTVRAAEGNAKMAMLKKAVRDVFPAYNRLNTVPRYSYIKGKPYLLPVAWAHRGVRSIWRKRVGNNLKAVVDSAFVDKETIDRREAIYAQWGL